MKPITIRISALIAILAAIAISPLALGQVVDPPVGIAVKVWANGVVGDPSGGDVSLWGDFLPSIPGGADGSVSAYGYGDYGDVITALLGAKGYIRVEPSKIYLLNVGSTNLDSAAVNIVAPPGFRVVMDGMIRTREETGGGVVKLQLLPVGAAHPGLAGLASTTPSTNIDFRVSLGNLKNGTSAGELALISTGTGSDWSNIAQPSSLYYEPLAPEITTYSPNNVLRQIVANQVVVDIVPLPANAPAYFEIRCYNPSQAVPYNPAIFPYSFTGQPYVTQPGGAGTKS